MAEQMLVWCPECTGYRDFTGCPVCQGRGVIPATPEQIVEAANELQPADENKRLRKALEELSGAIEMAQDLGDLHLDTDNNVCSRRLRRAQEASQAALRGEK